jgi:hypothetical protein
MVGVDRGQRTCLCRLTMSISNPPHGASRLHRLGGGSVRDRAQELLNTLEAKLSTDTYDAAWERGNAQEFDQIVVDLLANR